MPVPNDDTEQLIAPFDIKQLQDTIRKRIDLLHQCILYSMDHNLLCDEERFRRSELMNVMATIASQQIEENNISSIYRPKTRGELRDKLQAGVPCEVAAYVASMTDIMLRGWLRFDAFTVCQSPNDGWAIFMPDKVQPQESSTTPPRERIAGLVEGVRQTILNIPADWSDEDILSFAIHYMTSNRQAIEEEMERRLELSIENEGVYP
ncbi:MAG: hypothetical protein WC455_09310 [Dehalococcoidia bacterium]